MKMKFYNIESTKMDEIYLRGKVILTNGEKKNFFPKKQIHTSTIDVEVAVDYLANGTHYTMYCTDTSVVDFYDRHIYIDPQLNKMVKNCPKKYQIFFLRTMGA